MESKTMSPEILIIGASGFVGSNLLRFFETKHLPVRAFTRDPKKFLDPAATTEIFEGDLENEDSVKEALRGIKTIYYLAHSMDYAGVEFMERERLQAKNVASKLDEGQRLIYLGGIVPEAGISQHLQSRKAVGDEFKASKAQAIEFRASIVVGRGSASFETVRALVGRLPFVITTEWSGSMCQPIAIKDVVSYLASAREIPMDKKHKVFEIGGADRLRYDELMATYAKESGLLRPKLHLNALPKAVAKEILGIVVPEYHEVGAKLLDSIEANTVARNEEALKTFDFTPIGYKEAIELAADPSFKDPDFTETLKKLKGHSEIPRYLSGQTLQKSFDLPDSGKLEELSAMLGKYMPKPLKGLKKEAYRIKIPFIGEIELIPSEKDKRLLLAYKPKYFFQSAGWVFFDRIAGEAQRLVRSKTSRAE